MPVRIPERISVRTPQVRCSLSWKVQMIMENHHKIHSEIHSTIHMDVWGKYSQISSAEWEV